MKGGSATACTISSIAPGKQTCRRRRRIHQMRFQSLLSREQRLWHSPAAPVPILQKGVALIEINKQGNPDDPRKKGDDPPTPCCAWSSQEEYLKQPSQSHGNEYRKPQVRAETGVTGIILNRVSHDARNRGKTENRGGHQNAFHNAHFHEDLSFHCFYQCRNWLTECIRHAAIRVHPSVHKGLRLPD